MPLYEFLRLAIEKLESSQQKPCPVDPCLEGENESVDTVTRSPATLGSSVSARQEKCGGVEYIFNEISPSDLGPKDPWLSYGTSSGHLDNSFRPLSDPSILSGGLTNDNAIAMPAAQPKELLLHGMAKNVSLDTFMNKDKCLVQNNAAYSVRAVDGDRATTSSVSSGNSADDRASYEEKHAKNNEELECQSDELQNASVGVKKSSPGQGGRGLKRRRAAEVHNLSERRRRDRINQKMQALQQLIPNCNKADKASMLDEAIEYLKNLKHQVQMMSMGCGSCVMYPGAGHMYDAGMPHFSYMGMGMGMRMGGSRSFGYTNPPRCPVFPSSAMGLVNLHAAPGMCGHPGSVVYRTVPVGWQHTTFNNNSQPSRIRSSPAPHAHQN